MECGIGTLGFAGSFFGFGVPSLGICQNSVFQLLRSERWKNEQC